MTDCLFCRIVAGTIPADVVRETNHTLAFRDIDPQAPVHVLVIPKKHYADAAALATADPQLLAQLVSDATEVAAEANLDAGYRLVMNTGVEGGQTVFHAHVHVLGGRTMAWPPG